VSSVMGSEVLNVGQKLTLQNRITRAVLAAAFAGTLGLGLFMSTVGEAVSGGETRTISLVHQHTKEKLTVTYMKNGRYVPSAMKQLNRFFRDWRRNEVIRIDPRTIDLVWELHADLGSKKPIHIVSGYRSPKTNAFLKRIGRNVAKKSQHMRGKAIDFFFPDVNTKTIRNSASARRVGGVGYYRSAGGPTGFLHADSGNVRNWGPKARPSEIKAALRTIGRRVGKRGAFDGATETASLDTGSKKSRGLLGWWRGDSAEPETLAPAPVAEAVDEPAPGGLYDGDADELAELSEDAAAATLAEAKAAKKRIEAELKAAEEARAKAKKPTPVADELPAFVEAEPDPTLGKKDRSALAALAGTAVTEQQGDAQVAGNLAIPRPRLKPKSVQLVAASLAADVPEGVVIQPVSGEPTQSWATKKSKPSPVVDPIGTVEDPESLLETAEQPTSNADGKSNLDADIRVSSAEDLVTIEPVVAPKSEPSWIGAIYDSAEASLRRDGVNPAPAAIAAAPVAAVLGPDGSGEIEISAPVAAEGKGDSQFVNRDGKSSLPTIKLRLSERAE
jgi:uncharacterized protein YcbK (DUF882 family)